MLPKIEKLLRDEGAELVIGLVGPVGADLDTLEKDLIAQLKLYEYESNLIRMSSLLNELDLGVSLDKTSEYTRLMTYMNAGDALRVKKGSGEILALWAMASIASKRNTARMYRTAHILRSIKHPDEARALRAVYGSGFVLIGLSASTEQRKWLLKNNGLTSKEATEVIERDENEEPMLGHKLGQQTREAFDLADVFIRQSKERSKTAEQLDRFLSLLFGAVAVTPTADEYAMFLAYSSALRSADLSRQVGAVVWKKEIGVVATGCNDVPAPGGGLYWPGPNDKRDHVQGSDANEVQKKLILDEVTERIGKALSAGVEGFATSDATKAIIREACEQTRLNDITEFGRAVHAEMDALLSCGRAGISTIGATLFSTTFPCHNCAKHIVASGIHRVVYIEPYEKSLAFTLHPDSIEAGERSMLEEPMSESSDIKKVVFEPFVGVGPRRFFDLFSMKLSEGYPLKRKNMGNVAPWNKSSLSIVRTPMLPTSYIEREAQLAAECVQELEQ